MHKFAITGQMVRRLSAILGCAFASAACNSAPDLDKELDTVRSWTATVRLADSERHAGATTRAFTTRLLGDAAEALGQSRKILPQATHTDAERVRANAAIDSLAAALQGAQRRAVFP